MNYVQQGDVILKASDIPKTAKVAKTDLLWKGQNHHHRLRGKFKILKKGDDVFVSSNGAVLFHEEHKDIKLGKGDYALSIVMEYDHLTEEAKRVVD